MKLLYKGSECGVPCTCPAAEEEYVWWKYAVASIATDSNLPNITISMPAVVTPICIRVTADKPVIWVAFTCNSKSSVNPSQIVRYEITGTISTSIKDITLSGQEFDLWPIETSTIYISANLNSSATRTYWTDIHILVSKSDYAKLVEASGS